MPRAAILSAGAVTPCGSGVAALDDALRACRQQLSHVEFPAPRGKSLYGALPERFRSGPQRALAAASEAMAEALDMDKFAARHCGLILSTIAADSEDLEVLLSPFAAANIAGSAREEVAHAWHSYANDDLARALAECFGISGPRTVLTNACASGNVALGVALDWIRRGRVPCVIVVGVDVVKTTTLWGAEASGFIGRKLAPFDTRRNGAILGEGAGALWLMAEDRLNGRQPLAWLDGFGCVCDRGAAAITLNEDGSGLSRAMVSALIDAEADPASVDVVSAHAPGTQGIDAIETRAIARVFPGKPPRVNATKSITSHLSGASAIVEAIAGVLQITGSYVHGNAGLAQQGDDICLRVEPATTASATPRIVLSNACGGGGTNSSILIRDADGTGPQQFVIRHRVAVSATAMHCWPVGERDAGAYSHPDPFPDWPGFSHFGKAAQYAAIAGTEALACAGIAIKDGDRVAVVGGTAFGGSPEAMDAIFAGLRRSPPSVLPSEALNHGIHLGATLVARLHHLTGYTATVSGSGLAGIKAFSLACELVENGRADAAICVAYDSWDPLFEMLPDGSSKSDAGESEGAVAIVVERAEAVADRGQALLALPETSHEAKPPVETIGRMSSSLLAVKAMGELAECIEAGKPRILAFEDPPSAPWVIRIDKDRR